MSGRARRLLRPLVRRLLPGAPVAGQATPPGRELLVDGADGRPITVTDEGQGPAVLLLHPGSADRSSWAGVAAAVGGRPLLVGHSSGAVVALESALAAPAAFRAMVLYEPPVAVAEPVGGEALRRAITIHLREIVGAGRLGVAAMRLVPPLWRFERGHAAAQITDDEAIESLGVGVDRYAGLDLPVLLLGGGRSPAHLRARLDALAAVLPRLDSVVVLERQGHLATLTAPGKVAEVIAAFADRLS